MPLYSRIALITTIAALAACTKADPSPAGTSGAVSGASEVAVAPSRGATDAASAATPQAGPPAAWLGTWTGPEGTSLEILAAGAGYDVIVKNLDGPRKFTGKPEGGGISFERDGVTESIKAGNGAQTGMKWLDGKLDCLVVKAGEGYCRG